MISYLIFDLDQTLVDTSALELLRKRRQWSDVYGLIHKTTLYDGILELLNFLNEKGIFFAVLTSSPSSYCNKILNYHNINADKVIGYHDVKRVKPSPEGIIKIINSLPYKKNQIMHIGDQANDVIASKNAGIISVAALWGNLDNRSILDSEPDYIASNPIQIIEFL